MQETSTKNYFVLDFPAGSFFEFFEQLLINDIKATSGNRNIILFILKWEVLNTSGELKK